MKRAAKPTSRRYISKSGMLSSALPFAVMAMSSTAYAQTADNSASVAVPAGAVELSVANNSATDSDTVLAVITNNDDDFTASPINGSDGGDTPSIYTNDTLNGDPIDPDAVTSTITDADGLSGVSINDDGTLSVPADTPAGTYEVVVETCEDLNPTNCMSTTTTIVVEAAELALAPLPLLEPVDSTDGNPELLNVFDDVTLDGEPAARDGLTVTVTDPADPATPGALVPVLDPVTGIISVPPGTPAGNYDITYEICEVLNPANCVSETVSVVVDPPIAGVSGIVFLDENGDGVYEESEELLADWIVEITDSDGNIVAEVMTDENGFYEASDLPLGTYDIIFRNPVNGVSFGRIEGVELTGGNVTVNQNLPIDPSGVVYDAITRQPVSGTLVTLLGANGDPLPTVCFVDPAQQNQVTDVDGMYRFDIIPGATAACPITETEYEIVFDAPATYSDDPSTIIAPQPGALNPPPGAGSFLVAPQATAPTASEDTTYYLRFVLGTGDRDVINNHIALDPFENRSALMVSKTSTKRTASVGDLVPYTITVRNAENVQRSGVDIVDIIPPGFKYVPGSAIVNNVALEPEQTGRELRWTNQTIPAASSSIYNLTMVVGAGVSGGDRVNTALGRNGFDGSDVSNRGQAVVSIVASAIFDCAEIIGKVFDDRDGDGYQDKGEPGIPHVRMANVNGQLITTDEFGRYHITCAAVPDARIGSNYILKVDTRTLPSGYVITSENPRAVRLTRGKVTKLNFGAKLSKKAVISLDRRAFLSGSAELKTVFVEQMSALQDQVDPKNPVIRIDYARAEGEDAALAKERADNVAQAVAKQFTGNWDGSPASIETNVIIATGNQGGE